MTSFLLDANLAPALARRLVDLGYDGRHVFDVLPADATDARIAELANNLGAAIVTKDADYFALKERGFLRTALIWLRVGNMSNRLTAQLLLPAMPRIVASIQAGERIIEIR